MRISSLSTPFVDPSFESGQGGSSSGLVTGFFRNLNQMLTAMAYAEAGDLDAVKEILDRKQMRKKR